MRCSRQDRSDDCEAPPAKHRPSGRFADTGDRIASTVGVLNSLFGTRDEHHLHTGPPKRYWPHHTQRTYPYKGFEVTLDLEPVWEATGSAVPSLPIGFVAKASIGGTGNTECSAQ